MDDIRFNGLTVKPHKGFVIYFLNGIRCDFTDLKKLSEDDNFGLKHRKKYQNFIDQNESEKDEFFRVCTDIQMNNMKTNSQKGQKRVRNAGKTTLSQPIFTEERFEERPQSKKEDNSTKKGRKKARNAGKTSLSQPIFTEDQLEERPQSKKKTTSPKMKKKRKNAGNDSQKKNDINKSPTKEGLKMTRSSKNDLQIDEDISLPFDINHLTNVCEKARLEYTNKLVVVESSESDEIMVVSSNEILSQKGSMEKKIESIFTNTEEDEDDILEEWSEDANSDRSGDTKLSKVVLEANIIGINWRDNLCWFDNVIHSLTFVEGFVDWLKAIDTNEAKMLRAMLVSIRNSTTISRRKSRELKNLLMSARDKLLKSAPQEYRNGDLNHVSSAIVILDAIFQKHPKYKGDMTSDYFRVYDKNICEGKTVVPLAPTVVYLKDKPLLNDLPILCRDFFNATSWEINSTKYYYNYSQEVHLIIYRAPSEYLFISCSDLDFRFDSLLDWSLGGNRYWLQSLVLFQGNHYTSLVRIISTWYHFNDIGRSTYKGKKIKTPKDNNNLLAGQTVSLLIFSKSKY
ncbi:hypothetical protein M0813_00625 [Anaeramoeba flamelloides]|uniref:Uncharacterized protein n=1 Tax=Anaeramoeba flamelloides TaxID=1746091 RepID=A0ABQ8XMZ3_9EUKA|nr:hypothetical protein M0813_00625 [Anaeramoeba flamelloides]